MWFALLFSIFVHADVLETVEVRYVPPPVAPSCGLLKQREAVREKVVREHAELKGCDQLRVNHLLLNKLFMPTEVWQDESVFVQAKVKISEDLALEIDRLGLDGIYLSLDAPGLRWESYSFQTPAGLSISMNGEGHLMVAYQTYLNVLCLEKLETPEIEWVPSALAPGRPNQHTVLTHVLPAR